MPDREQLPLRVRDLHFGFGEGQFQLQVPEIDIAAGRTAVCVGPSGSGKSTLLHLLAGILLAQHGGVSLGGVDWAALTDAQRRLRRIRSVGLVFQEFELLDYLTVRENILLPYLVQRSLELDRAAEESALELARVAGIDRMLARLPKALSQGERQRVAICRALVTGPPVVLADEPTGNLDPGTTGRVLDLLLSQVRERGTTLVMVTHDHSLLESFDQVVEFRADEQGAVVTSGDSDVDEHRRPNR